VSEPTETIVEVPAAKPAGRSRKLMLVGGALTALLLAGGGGAYLLSGGSAAAHEKAATSDAEEAKGEKDKDPEPLDVPPMLVNLRSADGAAHFIKLHIMIEPGAAGTADELKKRLPELIDAYQPFLRELRPEDLAGSAAVYRIKEELMLRAAGTLGHDRVKDVLIQDLIQQ
jgi:flagellar FliL protein